MLNAEHMPDEPETDNGPLGINNRGRGGTRHISERGLDSQPVADRFRKYAELKDQDGFDLAQYDHVGLSLD